jgi:hypothetical protein
VGKVKRIGGQLDTACSETPPLFFPHWIGVAPDVTVAQVLLAVDGKSSTINVFFPHT